MLLGDDAQTTELPTGTIVLDKNSDVLLQISEEAYFVNGIT